MIATFLLLLSMLARVGSGSPTAAARSVTGTGSSDSAASSWLSPSDLGMRSDTLVSPRVSPLMQHRRVPSLVVTSSVDKSGNSSLQSKAKKFFYEGAGLLFVVKGHRPLTYHT